MPDPFYIASAERSDWYPGPRADDRFWPPYHNSLAGKGWALEDIKNLDRASSRVIQLMRSPGASAISTRGLVVGYVQSGKTANYAASIAKAADTGYRLIIVLAGGTNVLRRQTQERLHADLVSHRPQDWVLLTTDTDDFGGNPNAAAALSEKSGQRTLAVIKKNKTRIKRLTAWLKSAGSITMANCPILIVDDEADQASPNSAMPDAERTKINEALLALLAAGPKVAYVGYTATPFANLLIDPSDEHDLYPRSFVVDLPRPDSYFGPEKIFGRAPLSSEDAEAPPDGLDMIRLISQLDQQQLLAVNTGGSRDLPASLRRSLHYFLLVTAERYRRGQHDRHSSMLVHTSQKISSHQNMVAPLERCINEIRLALKHSSVALIEELKDLWEHEAARVATERDGDLGSFDDILPHFNAVLSKARVVVENSASTSRLNYSGKGQVVVAVGGNVLARGLTLEGLSVSYFIRAASAYDTLLQMGRWFGYRPGYADLPRIWMTDELRGYFFDLGTVEAEIRKEIAQYERVPGMNPLSAGVRIRTHPKLAITAKAKMSAAVKSSMSFRGRRFQTTIMLNADLTALERNLAATRTLVAAVSAQAPFSWNGSRSAYLARGASADVAIAFLEQYDFAKHPELENKSLLLSYIKKQVERGLLGTWNVAIASRAANAHGVLDLASVGTVNMIRRTKHVPRSGPLGDSIGSLMSERDVAIDFADSVDVGSIKGDLLAERNQSGTKECLLVLYPIAPNISPGEKSPDREPLIAAEVVIGVAVVFPDVDDGEPLSYVTVDLSQVPRESIASASELGMEDEGEGTR